jgi:trimeric autotransporter adhesin
VITYSGDTAYAPSQFGLSLNNPLTDFSMLAQNPNVTVTAGSTGTATLNLGSINGFNAAVALTCTAPTGMSCILNPTSVTVNGNTTATLTINASTPASSVKFPGPSARRMEWLAASGGAALAGVFLLGLPARRRRWRSMLSLVCLAVLAAGIGCGGGGGSGSSTPTPPTTPTPPPTSGATPTPAGTYTIVVTGSQGTSLAHAIAVTVIVTASS